MLRTSLDELKDYLSSLYGTKAEIVAVTEIGKKTKPEKELKGFGYGVAYLLEFRIGKEIKNVVFQTMRPEGFGHDHFSDRAQTLLWQHCAFNKLPRHVRSVDVGAFTCNGKLKSVGDCTEFFIITEKADGQLYHLDLDRIKGEKRLNELDEARCEALAGYLVEVHSVRKDLPRFYVRRIRDLIGHGEGIMGLADSYPPGLDYIREDKLCEIEKKCVEWRWKLKQMSHRCAQVHGDFHPWNILLRQGIDFTVLDRSRGEWGEPADDTSALSINYIFYGLQIYGRLAGPFERLFKLFWNTYLDKTGDEEMFKVIPPFFAWRGLVVASPVWYPHLSPEVRNKLLRFVDNVLEAEEFRVDDVNGYFS